MASAGSSKGAEEKGTAHAVPSSPAASSHTAHEKESNEDHEQEAAPAIAAAVATVEENREEAPKRKRRRWWSKDEPVLKPGPQTQRYLPLVSGLLAPFSVLLDVSSCSSVLCAFIDLHCDSADPRIDRTREFLLSERTPRSNLTVPPNSGTSRRTATL